MRRADFASLDSKVEDFYLRRSVGVVDVGLLVVTTWLKLLFPRLIAPVVTTHHLLSAPSKIQNGDPYILVPANQGPPGKWPLKRREREREREICMIPWYHSIYCHWILCDIVWLWGPRSVCWWEKQKKVLEVNKDISQLTRAVAVSCSYSVFSSSSLTCDFSLFAQTVI